MTTAKGRRLLRDWCKSVDRSFGAKPLRAFPSNRKPLTASLEQGKRGQGRGGQSR